MSALHPAPARANGEDPCVLESAPLDVACEDTPANIVYNIARTRAQREAAFRLIHAGYVEKGLMAPNEYGMRVTPWHLLPSTQVYVAQEQEEVIYTMSLVPGDWMDLPLEELYGEEVRQLRTSGASLAEVTCLTSSQKYDQATMFDVFVELVALMFQQARYLDIDGLVIAVHPRHAGFYARHLGFRRFGPERKYALVGDKPAVLCYHDFTALDNSGYPLFDRVYGRAVEEPKLKLRPMPPDDVDHFSPIAEALASEKAVLAG